LFAGSSLAARPKQKTGQIIEIFTGRRRTMPKNRKAKAAKASDFAKARWVPLLTLTVG
jgi:hypothetical protein